MPPGVGSSRRHVQEANLLNSYNSKPHKYFQQQPPDTYGEMLFFTLAPAWLPGDKTFGWNYLNDHAPYWLTLIRQAIPGCWGEYIRSNRDDDPATRRHVFSTAHLQGVIYTPPGSPKVDCAALEARLEAAMHPEILRRDGRNKAVIQPVKSPVAVLRYLAAHNILRDHNKGRRRRDKFGEWPPEPICETKEEKKNIFIWKPILIRDSEMFEFFRAKMPFGDNKLQAFLTGIAYYTKSFCIFSHKNKNINIKVFGQALGRRHRAHAGVVGGLAPLRQACLTYRVNYALFINHFRRWLWPTPRGPGPPSRAPCCFAL